LPNRNDEKMMFNEKDPEKEKMEKFASSCKPLEEMLDSVRNIEGFPIGKDEDILALSDAPWYTACPNPYINDFIEAFGKPYDEDTDTYENKPFVHDVSEGKNDPIYNVHSYHTKVPHKAIMPFIEHYTVKEDIVFDGFCGTGMTGVAARILNRKAILCDLSPIASFIAHNYNSSINNNEFQKEAKKILKEIENECLWMYETLHSDRKTRGIINYVVWSDVLICPYCKNEYVFWDVAVDIDNGKMNEEYYCPHCKSLVTKKDSEKSMTTFFDSAINQKITQMNQVPILINYSIGNKRYEKTPDKFDWELIKKIEESSIPYWHPTNEIPRGDKTVEPLRAGITHVHHFYSKRNLWVLAAAFNIIKNHPIQLLKTWLTSSMIRTTKMYKFTLDRKMGTVNGTLYLPSLWTENSPFKLLKNKLSAHAKIQMPSKNTVFVQCTSSTNLSTIPSNCVDYIFTDPPFGGNLMYSELNFLWECWLKVATNNVAEAIINSSQNKGLEEYKNLMASTFKEMYRILKPNRWITVEFHNTKPSVWNAIQDALSKAGFIVAQVTVLDKKQGSFNQVGAPGSVQNDLIINAYKQKREFHQKFLKKAGEFLELDFVEDHLEHLPVEPNIGRSEKMLFSKLLAHYVKDGYEIRLNSKQFYELLKENFKIIDGYWFKDDEISKYEEWKKANGLQAIEEIAKKQLTLFINDEKSSIIWLYNFLETPKTYNDLLTAYNQAITKIDDEVPELKELLDTNFIFENGMYRRPLTDKERAEKEEKNEKELLKAFDKIVLQARSNSKKIKSIRKEAIKIGFIRAYQEKRFEDILAVSKKLDKDILENSSEINDFVEIARVKVGEY
jgi:DNA modification methylase